jgi:hypothetical protein
MIKFNIDIATTRRLSGWIFDMNGAVIDECYIGLGNFRQKIPLRYRTDVSAAFNLGERASGIEINIPDVFDNLTDNYKLYIKDTEIFCFKQQLSSILTEIEETDLSASPPSIEAVEPINYSRGKHVVFIYDEGSVSRLLEKLSTPRIQRFFPNSVSGCTFSRIHISGISAIKKQLLNNLSNILFVTPSRLYPALFAASPSICDGGRFITIYRDGGLVNSAGTEQFQINNFLNSKTRNKGLADPFHDSLLRVWELIENYADVIFPVNPKLFFYSTMTVESTDLIDRYISQKIQNKSNYDVVRVQCNDSSVTVVSLASYPYLFDRIGTDACWSAAVERGLTHTTVTI